MPIYEYQCADCGAKFGKLRPMSQADSPAACLQCGSGRTSRVLSLFSAMSKGSNGHSHTVAGGSSCASCAAHNCATCGQ
ncbi:MAG: zinc ribbon domain-containing protein [Anaerolineae bacterium]|nr:zinc ribbon domain-containing protein [Anaerolineae bacterium]